MIGKIQRKPLREVWPHEALDFTRWLQENIDVLGDVLDLRLSNVDRERGCGDFCADLVAEDEAGNVVIIENQLELSDHDHLGKLITYLTALEAKSAVWIVAHPRPEHVRAIAWLNESTSSFFYLVKLEAIAIDDSRPAPLLTLITGPSEETSEAGATKKDLAERHVLYKRFWTGVLERAKTKTQLHAHISPGQYHWIGTSAGTNGVILSYVIKKHEGQVELYIDSDKDTGEGNEKIFRALRAHEAEIERAFGDQLEWEPLEDRRACRIKYVIDAGGLDDEQMWPQIQETMADAMARLEKALRPHLEDALTVASA